MKKQLDDFDAICFAVIEERQKKRRQQRAESGAPRGINPRAVLSRLVGRILAGD
jgi:hypothetical protein